MASRNSSSPPESGAEGDGLCAGCGMSAIVVAKPFSPRLSNGGSAVRFHFHSAKGISRRNRPVFMHGFGRKYIRRPPRIDTSQARKIGFHRLPPTGASAIHRGGVAMSGHNVLNGAQVIVDYLIREKVPTVFGLCGHGNIQFIDALYERAGDIKTVSVHHESVAGFMADVYYRVSGRPTATFTSCGPGSANLPISLGNAFLDSVPFMAVTGNVPTSQFNRGAFQELYRHYQADFPSTVRSYCKKVFQPTRGEMVPLAIRQAWKTMTTGRPGPVVLDVPFDVFMESAAEEAPNAKAWNGNISSRCGADPEGVVKVVDMLLGAERPVMIVGQGVSYGGAAGELLKLAERLQIPVAASASGLGAIDCNHRLALGLVARAGHYQANHATRQADVLLAMGMRFDDRTSSSWIPGYSFTIPPTKLIHVDIDPEEIGRNYPVALGLMADVRTFLRQLLAEVASRKAVGAKAASRRKWLATIDGYRQEWNKCIAPGFIDDSTPIHPQRA